MVSPFKKRKIIRGKTYIKEERKSIKSKVSYKPLNQKRFYLDLTNYKNIENLKKDLYHLGGIVEDFLVKEINYVITNRNINNNIKDSSSELNQHPSPSPQYIYSPTTPQLPSSVHSNSWDSPNLDSSKEEWKKKAKTRAEVLVERACQRRRNTNDVLESARVWSIPVWSLSKLLTWLKGLKESPLYHPPNPISSSQKQNSVNGKILTSESVPSYSKVRRLKETFIKVEGFKREFRPHFKELQKLPVLNLNNPQDVSPFGDRKSTKQERDISSKHKDPHPERQKAFLNKKRGGFCELCSSNYSDLQLHLRSENHLAFLGETLYSGPPSIDKEGDRNDVIPSVSLPLKAELIPKEPANILKTDQKLTCIKETQSDLAPKNNLKTSETTKSPINCDDKLLPCEKSESVNDNSVNTLQHSDTNLNLSDKKNFITVQNGNELNSCFSSNHCVDGDQKIQKEMVRLIQEPQSKIDPHSLRKGIRISKTRVGSGDYPTPNSALKVDNPKCKQSQKELRNRSINCLSDRSDSESSEQLGNNDLNMCEIIDKSSPRCRKPKNSDNTFVEDNHVSVPGKLNGVVNTCVVNGVNKLKARRVSRANSDDSDNVSFPKVNGVDVDNDRVDINLLLEISAKDRKRFESKKAKIKRKCADWMLITETERYYNEKEEILRNKNRDDSESESDSSVNLNQNKKNERKVIDSKPSSKGKKSKIIPDSTSSRKGRSSCISQASKKLTTTEEELSLPCIESVSRIKVKGKSLLDRKKEIELKPRKRLSDAERFLRDNKEYYQFPETRERLRKNTSSVDKECFSQNNVIEEGGEQIIVEEEEEEDVVEDDNNESKIEEESKELIEEHLNKEESPCKKSNSNIPKNKKRGGKRRKRKISCKTSADSDIDLPVGDEIKNIKVSDDSEYKTLDGLYFSFEGAPVQESWYQTYQRYIDGAESNEFVYEQDPFKFVLPYEMPKEYFKELFGKRSLLSRKKNELAELVRKSPRCHASTLALFSNIFPGKKRKSRKCKPIKIEDNSSDGTNTPIPEANKFPLLDAYETEEEMMLIGQCMDQIMKSALDEPLSYCEENDKISSKEKDSRKISSKRKSKGKKGVAPVKIEKPVIPVDSKVFDNPLSSEIDYNFLVNLPTYLKEVNIVPEDTLQKDSVDLLTESGHCECTERTSCDEASSADERTEVSSESLSICDSETVDSFNSSFSTKVRKPGAHKKRRKNLTGWPTQKRRKPPPSLQASDDNDNSSFSFDDHKPKRRRSFIKRRNFELLEPQSDPHLESEGSDRRTSSRKRSSVLYMDTWPLRFRNYK